MKRLNLIGERYGRLVVIDKANDYVSPSGKKEPVWKCKCDCGTVKNIRQTSLRSGDTASCGCYSSELHSKVKHKHGDGINNRLYRIWSGSKNRCLNPNNRDYSKYGGRGITYYELWINDYMAFKKWALANGYDDTLTLDRKDNDKGYCPENCRWVNYEVQENNRRNNIHIEINGEKKTVAQWAREKGVAASFIHDRIKLGWDEKDAVMIPKGGKGQKSQHEINQN